MRDTMYYFGFHPEELDGHRKKVFDYICRMSHPGVSIKLVPIAMDTSNPHLFKQKHTVIFPAAELTSRSAVHPKHIASSFCIVSPGDDLIFTIVG